MPTGADTIRVKFDIAGESGSNSKGKIYKNGVALGIEQTNDGSGGAYYTKSEDLAFGNGDTLELWTKQNVNDAVNPARVKNLRVCGYGVLNANMSGANTTP